MVSMAATFGFGARRTSSARCLATWAGSTTRRRPSVQTVRPTFRIGGHFLGGKAHDRSNVLTHERAGKIPRRMGRIYDRGTDSEQVLIPLTGATEFALHRLAPGVPRTHERVREHFRALSEPRTSEPRRGAMSESVIHIPKERVQSSAPDRPAVARQCRRERAPVAQGLYPRADRRSDQNLGSPPVCSRVI
jgi:hypothetical protein